MKKFLLMTNSFIRLDGEGNKYFEPHLNARLESLDSTGIIFVEEYGSFYLAPTSLQKESINIQATLGIQTPFRNSKGYSNLKCLLFFRTKVGNFSLGYYGMGAPPNSFPLTYFLKIYNFSLGVGVIYNNESVDFSNDLLLFRKGKFIEGRKNYLVTNVSTMYRTIIGNFSLSLNNFLFKVFSDPLNLISNISLKPNLRIGHGKEFKLDYMFNRIQLNSFYLFES